MKLPRATTTLAIAAFISSISPFATAHDTGWYLGGNLGQSRVKIDDERIISGLLGSGFATTSITDDDRDLGYKLFGGYQFNPHFSLEGGYFDLGKFGFTAVTQPPGTLTGAIKLRGVNLDLLGRLPITQRFSAFARLGVNYAEAKDTFAGTGAANVLSPNRKKSDANYKIGFGVQYDFTQHLAMRVEAERYRIDDAVGNRGDADLVSAGLVFHFGSQAQAISPLAKTSEPLAAATPPELTVMKPPAKVAALTTVAFSASSLFDFDKATVKPEGKKALDVFAAQLHDTRFEIITVTGHTDRFGSEAYNLDLSTRRAEAVRAYLLTTTGIPPEKIAARGASSSQPLTKLGECPGQSRAPETRACLQPDRRVQVDVYGTR